MCGAIVIKMYGISRRSARKSKLYSTFVLDSRTEWDWMPFGHILLITVRHSYQDALD
jgi:hypothetical protein